MNLHKSPMRTPRGKAQDRRYTFCSMVAMAAEKHRSEAEKHGLRTENFYWLGYRNAYTDIMRLLEGSIDSSSNLALSDGWDEFQAWVKSRGEEL